MDPLPSITVTGTATAIQVHGPFNQHNYNGNGVLDTSHEQVMDILRKHITPGAFHDSAERGNPPKCHENTRVAVLMKIMDWLQNPNNRHLFVWLFGPAGAGKTAIAGTIAEMAQQLKILAATFFFSRFAAGRNTKDTFIVTLAYQLARFIPEMKFYLKNALDDDPAIFSRSLSSQLVNLILSPLNAAVESAKSKPTTAVLIIVDGLDECDKSSDAYQCILKLLSDCATLSKYPIRFLVASRPEWQIRQAFSAGDLGARSIHLALDEDYRADDDIRTLFVSELARIKMYHPASEDISPDWPPDSDIVKLVEKASRQFIYASTVIKFVDCDDDDPVRRLEMILGISPVGDLTPFAQLDAIYSYILTSGIPSANLEDTITLLLVILLEDSDRSLTVVADIVGCLSTRLKILLNGLNALVGSSNERLSMYHASFGDFLFDPLRAGNLHISTQSAHERLAICWLRLVRKHQALGISGVKAKLGNQLLVHLQKISLTEELEVLLQHTNLLVCLELEVKRTVSLHWLDLFMEWLRKMRPPQGTPRLPEKPETETSTQLPSSTELERLYYLRIYHWVLQRVQVYPEHIHPSLLIMLSVPNHMPRDILGRIWARQEESQQVEITAENTWSCANSLSDLRIDSDHGGISKKLISQVFHEELIRIERYALLAHDYTTLAINMLPVVLGLHGKDQEHYVSCIEVLSRTVLPKAARDPVLANLIQGFWLQSNLPPWLDDLGCPHQSEKPWLKSAPRLYEPGMHVQERYQMATCVLAKAGWDYLKRSNILIKAHQHDDTSYQVCFLCSGPSCAKCLIFDGNICPHHGSLENGRYNPHARASSDLDLAYPIPVKLRNSPTDTKPDELRGLECYCATRAQQDAAKRLTKSRKFFWRRS